MGFEDIKQELETNSIFKFKLYSLEYLIEKIDNYIQIYATDYPTRKSKYNSLEELMNHYTVYNEPLITILNNMKKID